MSPDLSLKEHVTHGTPKNPLRSLHFTAGPGTGYPDHFFVERHWHEYIEILLILKGAYLVEINLEPHTLREGDLCILNSGELHQITGSDAKGVHDAILFDPRILSFSYEDEWQETCIAPFLNRTLTIKNILHPAEPAYAVLLPLVRLLAEQAPGRTDNWYPRCKLTLLELFAQLQFHGLLLPAEDTLSLRDHRRITRYKTLVSYMKEHCQEPLTLQQLADLIDCNSQYLCRFFREIAGVSPIRYLIALRIDRACTLLAGTSRPITDIALDCGFENISYFIRTFRAHRGCTPREYRALQS